MNFFLADDAWHQLAADLMKAAENPADPETEIKIVLAAAGVMPECCREDCEGEVLRAA
jgi:hypothetical protein